jgi:hypothetical protein
MRAGRRLAFVVGGVAIGAAAWANNPPGSPPLGGPMSHVLVTVFEGEFVIGFESPQLNPVELQGPGEGYAGAAGVLNGAWFNAQYGWLPSGFWAPPPGAELWVRLVDQTPGLRCHIGRPYGPYAQFDPILTTDGSEPRFVWDGGMLHNYYAVDTLGPFETTYEVYFGDAHGDEIPGAATPGLVTLAFEFGHADVDGDGAVDVDDLYAWHAGAGDPDCDEDGEVTLRDRALLQRTVRRGESASMAGR